MECPLLKVLFCKYVYILFLLLLAIFLYFEFLLKCVKDNRMLLTILSLCLAFIKVLLKFTVNFVISIVQSLSIDNVNLDNLAVYGAHKKTINVS